MQSICTTLAVAVGVTGHRRIPDDQRPRIERQVAEILAQVKAALANPQDYWKGFKSDTVLRIVSCLADGADQLVAKVGLEQGYNLEALIPFPRRSEVHRRDRTEGQASLEKFDRLVAQAEHVLELAPEYSDDLPWDSDEAEVKRNRGYEQASLRMLDHSDILIAIWDGKPNDRSSSSARIVEQARKMQIPVFWVHPTDLNHELHLDDDQVTSILAKLLEKPDEENEEDHDSVSLDDFFNEKRGGSPFSWWGTVSSRLWKIFFGLIAPAPKQSLSSPQNQKMEEGDVEHYYNDADRLAGYYAGLFRSSFLLGCVLGALAITFAAMGGLWYSWKPFAWFCGVCELFILLGLYVNYHIATRGHYQQKLTYYRYIAEQLRHFDLLRRTGWVIPNVHATSHYNKGESIQGIRWYLRNVVRHIGVPDMSWAAPGCFTTHKTKIIGWIKEQKDYHENNHSRYELLEKRLKSFTKTLFALTVVCVVLHLIFLSSGFDDHHISSFLTITLPVWAMAAHALGHYAEANRLIDRSEAMSKRLGEYLDRVEHCETIHELDIVAHKVAYLMLQEVADWHIQYQMTELEIG